MAVERQTEYETIYIMRPTADDDARGNVRARVEGIINNSSGHLLSFNDWGSRRLAYRIRDRVEARYYEQGVYQYTRFLAPADTIAEIERNLRIMDSVLKFMTIKIEEDLIPEERLNAPVAQEEE